VEIDVHRWLALAVTVALVIAGCSSGEPEPQQSSPAGTAAPPSEAPTPTEEPAEILAGEVANVKRLDTSHHGTHVYVLGSSADRKPRMRAPVYRRFERRVIATVDEHLARLQRTGDVKLGNFTKGYRRPAIRAIGTDLASPDRPLRRLVYWVKIAGRERPEWAIVHVRAVPRKGQRADAHFVFSATRDNQPRLQAAGAGGGR
jgi:hypothetical protein